MTNLKPCPLLIMWSNDESCRIAASRRKVCETCPNRAPDPAVKRLVKTVSTEVSRIEKLILPYPEHAEKECRLMLENLRAALAEVKKNG